MSICKKQLLEVRGNEWNWNEMDKENK